MADTDLQDIIDTLIAEGYAEGPEGMRRIAETIINRGAIRDQSFGDVVRAKHQYTGYSKPGPEAVRAQQNPKARRAAEDSWALALQPGDPTGGADHYHADYVNPGWASKIPKVGTYGDHVFYRSRPIPPSALNNAVGTQLDVVPPRSRTAPTPQMPPARGNAPSDLIARSLANNSAAQARSSVADLFGPAANRNTPRLTAAGAVASPASMSTDWTRDIFPDTRRRAAPMIAQADLSQPRAVDDQIRALQQTTPNAGAGAALAALLGRGTAPTARPVPAMPTGIAQSYAGQESITPSTARAVANLLMPQRQQSYAGQESQRRDPFNGDPGGGQGVTIASIPTISSGVGKPPATRRVASVPVSPRDPVQSMPAFSEIASVFGRPRPAPTATAAIEKQFGPAVPGPNGYSSNSKDQSQLSPTLGAFAAMPGAEWFAPPTPRPREEMVIARAPKQPKPAMTTITEKVPNPDWTASLATASVPAGMKVNFGSRDSVAKRAAGVTAAQNVPQFITRTRQVPTTPTARAVVARRAASPAAAAIAQSFGNGGGGSSGGSSGSGSFQGTATGNSYNPGQQYRTGDGRTLQANADGSFTNVSTGQRSIGSSGSSGGNGHGSKSPGGQSYDSRSGTWV